MDEREMAMLTEGLARKADKMRVLERQGVARADIARFLNVRYQQVRNTLEGDKRTGYNPQIEVGRSIPEAPTDMSLDSAEEGLVCLHAEDDGSLKLPPAVSDWLTGGEGEPVYALAVDDGVFVTSFSGAMNRLRRSLAA